MRSLGAKGDGKTDDHAAIEAALKKADGQPVDGEGLTYAVYGTTDVSGVKLINPKVEGAMKDFVNLTPVGE